MCCYACWLDHMSNQGIFPIHTNSAAASIPLRAPAQKEAGLRCPRSFGTETYLFTKGSLSINISNDYKKYSHDVDMHSSSFSIDLSRSALRLKTMGHIEDAMKDKSGTIRVSRLPARSLNPIASRRRIPT